MKKGFTLIETLVATAIIVTATAGPLSLAGQSFAQANYIKDQITATYLAQEGLEIMRNIRDVNNISKIDYWYQICRLNGCVVDGTDYKMNPAPPQYDVKTYTTSNEYLKFDTDRNIYSYSSGTKSIYSRKIIIAEIVAGQEYKVTSSVKWIRGLTTRTTELSENLYDITLQ